MKNIFLLIQVFVLFVLINSGTYTVYEHEQAIKLQFGKVVGDPVYEPGLHFKVPFIQSVRKFDKRVLQLDGDASEVPTRDQKFVWVDTTARWKIENPLVFYRTLRGIPNALSRMSTILDGVTKDKVSTFNLIELVRNSNKIFEDIEERKKEALEKIKQDSDETHLEETDTVVERIKFGREKISDVITMRAREELKNYGVYIVDVQIRNISYKQNVEEKVYKRMISERMKIATKIRSMGAGEEKKILGQIDLALKKIESNAYRKSQTIKGEAEAKAIEIFDNALKSDPKLYTFLKTLETYEKTLGKHGSFILSTDHDFLKAFSNK